MNGRFRHIKRIAALVLCVSMLLFALSSGSDVLAASSKSAVVSSSSDIHSVFPKDYWKALDALQAAHPNWHFQAFYTGLDWDSCFDYNSAEMYPTRNLIEVSMGYSSGWYSTVDYLQYNGINYLLSDCTYADGKWYLPDGTEAAGSKVWSSYNWAGDCWNTYDSGLWAQASEEAVAYCMDVRNFLTEEQIFQFEDLAWNDTVTVAQVEKVFATVGGCWTTDKIKNDAGKKVSYGKAVYDIGKALKINPVALATRIVQEQGYGTSPLISGDYEFTITYGEDKGKTAKGYYNYFNLNACGEGYTQIYNNGLSEAYYGGSTSSSAVYSEDTCWDTRYRSLYGGAAKYASSYVSRGQSTYYLQKFNVDSSSGRLFWGQYMQAVLTPQMEAKKSYNSYVQAGTLDTEHYFLIPVFNNMPSEVCAAPSSTGNPNYKIGSVMLKGKAVSGFDTNSLEYSLSVTAEDSAVRLDVSPYSSAAAVTVENATNGQVLSSVGNLTDASLQLARGVNTVRITCTAENGSSRVYTLTISRPSVVTYGDINGDGKFSAIDLAYMTSHLLGTTTLTGDMSESADISGDGKISAVDLAYLTSYLLGKISSIPQR